MLTHDGQLGATYELGGTPFTLTELAATISDVLGTHIAYQDMSVADYTSALTAAGLPPEMAAAVADADAGLARGELFTASEDLVKLIGRPATTAHEAVQNAAAGKAQKRLGHTDRVTVHPRDARGRVKPGTTPLEGTAQ